MDDPLHRLQLLQRDLEAFAASQLPNLDRLAAELDASTEDLKRLLQKKNKSEDSRKELAPNTTPKPETVKIQDVEYKINDDFRQAAILVADELDLDELESAKLCIEASPEDLSQVDVALPYRALLRFHDYRLTLLQCLRLILQQRDELGDLAEDQKALFEAVADDLFKGTDGRAEGSTIWRKCVAGLSEVENALKKVDDHAQTALMTGQALDEQTAEAMALQRLFLSRQHEAIASIMTTLLRVAPIQEPDMREFLSKAASLEASLDLSVHYLPIMVGASTTFGSEDRTQAATARNLHNLFATGPAQLQWKQSGLKAAATVCWLAEYSARFADPTADPMLRVADRQQAEQERSDLFVHGVKNGAFHLLLAACKYTKPEVWHDPAKLGLVNYLLADAPAIPVEAQPASEYFAVLLGKGLQSFTNALISNMPDVIRRIKNDEDDQRRLKFSMPLNEPSRYEPDLERFIVIMAYAFQNDPDAAQDFWSDKDSNLYGFLRWVSQRLPTPRVAAFCELLTSTASDTSSANAAHRFLLEDTTMVSGRMRKTYSVSWAQIFAELDTYASSIREKPAMLQAAGQDVSSPGAEHVEGIETGIMLEAYLRLAAHVCRTSPEARNWLLREQNFHLGDNMRCLAGSGIEGRIRASCVNMLSAMLVDKTSDVNDGMWVLLDDWISAGGPPDAIASRPQALGRAAPSERHYLQRFNDRPETATAFVALLNGLITPPTVQAEPSLDLLPFPENLGAAHRHAGIDAYVDFAVGNVFRQLQGHMAAGADDAEISVLGYACLEFIVQALATFNEDLVLLANTTDIAVDSAIKTSSLAAYVRLHPFARVMEWLFNSNVISALFSFAQQDIGLLNNLDARTPKAQATLKAVQVMNLAMKLQTTFFDIVRPLVKMHSSNKATPVANAALASFDEVVLSQIGRITDITTFTTCTHVDLSLESLALLQKLSISRKLSDTTNAGPARERVGSRLISALSSVSDAVGMQLGECFTIYQFDLESGEEPVKLIKARAILDLLSGGLNASPTKPTVAHILLGFQCKERTVEVAPHSGFADSQSLFHGIATCAATAPVAIEPSNVSWLLAVKRGCLDVLLKLALSPLTANVVRKELRDMDFLDASAMHQIPTALNALWDSRPSTDPEALLDTSAVAITNFLHVRELFFLHAALELRVVVEMRAYSVQERIVSALRGAIRAVDQDMPVLSIFDLFDFVDIETAPALEVSPKYLADLDLSVCLKDDVEVGTAFDLHMAEELFILRRRELAMNGTIKDAAEGQQLDDEIRATLASLASQNSWRSIQGARLSTLEAWTDLLSSLVGSSGLEPTEVAALALHGLQVILPKFEKALSDSLESAALLAKLTLALVPVVTATERQATQQNADTAHERLLSAFRVCLKTLTDSSTDLALRDVCYRTCCAVAESMPLRSADGRTSPSPHAKQLMQLAQTAGDRLLTVITEDAFSGRGSTRVSALLFLDALVAVFQAARVSSSIFRALSKLNFLPVLIDSSIGSVASSFVGPNEDLVTTLAFFHTALALMLRTCRTADGTQVILNSGFFAAVTDSRLFSTDPDIGLDIDNPSALREFYRLLSAVLKVITALVVTRGSNNAATLQQAMTFLQQNRFSMQAVFKRTSALKKTSGPPEKEAEQVADEFARLMLVTGFLEDDEPAHQRASMLNGFT
ncbi:hypothetical protein B0A50_03675 [Salinomyces thailandicus]|uniref:Nucleoporin n=1 Tax=Salinomyces thailandicus TaxID=706561 RepID=A0A4U0U4T3_9PEZI|nr:hypothetical protein B0A50_03675 [Salinomyces thailandica]